MSRKTDLARLHREMREHPERFDYGDLPSGELTEAQGAEAAELTPAWLQELIAKRESK